MTCYSVVAKRGRTYRRVGQPEVARVIPKQALSVWSCLTLDAGLVVARFRGMSHISVAFDCRTCRHGPFQADAGPVWPPFDVLLNRLNFPSPFCLPRVRMGLALQALQAFQSTPFPSCLSRSGGYRCPPHTPPWRWIVRDFRLPHLSIPCIIDWDDLDFL